MFGELEILVFTLWTFFVVYTTWYFTSAKHYAPLTLKEARILWKIHKLDIRCKARRWREIRRGNKIIGFECECGYKHIQKRPIVAGTPTPYIQPQTSMFDKLQAPHK